MACNSWMLATPLNTMARVASSVRVCKFSVSVGKRCLLKFK